VLPGSFWRFWAAATTSMLGDGIRFAALPLLAAAVTRRPLPVAVVTLSATVPWLLFGLYAGVAVDRLNRRVVMVAVNAARALTVGALAVVVATDHVSLPVLYAVAFVVGTGEVFYDLAAAAFLPAIVAADRLTVANARLISAQILGRDLVGAAVGGLLFAASRAVPFSIDAATFAISAVLIASVAGSFRVPREDVRGSVRASSATACCAGSRSSRRR
jgi:hypothetical protein